MRSFGRTFKEIADHPGMRWLGPHNGVVHLALSSISNACWDLWSKVREVPLWKLILSLTPEELVATLDFSYLEETLSATDALKMLKECASTRGLREDVIRKGV